MPSPTLPCQGSHWLSCMWHSQRTYLITYRSEVYMEYERMHKLISLFGCHVDSYYFSSFQVMNHILIIDCVWLQQCCFSCRIEYRERICYPGLGGGCEQSQYSSVLLHLLHPGWPAGGGARERPHQESCAGATGGWRMTSPLSKWAGRQKDSDCPSPVTSWTLWNVS